MAKPFRRLPLLNSNSKPEIALRSYELSPVVKQFMPVNTRGL